MLEPCNPGYTGFKCAKCEKGFFKTGSGCNPCPEGALGIFVAAAIFAFVISYLLIRGMGKSANAYSGTIGIATKFFQVLAVVGKLEVKWPSSVKSTISVLTTPFSLKLDSLAPECSAPSISYPTKWIITMLLPLIFAVIFALLYLGAYLKARFFHDALLPSFKNRVINGYILLISLGYLTLASTAIKPFGCKKEIDGSFILLADPSLKCGDKWWRDLLPFTIIGIIVYLIGIPLGLFCWLRAHRSRLSDPEFVERYGGLFSSYVPGLPYWESFVMVEKILIAATGILVRRNVMLQLVLLQLVFVGAQSIYQEKRPFVRGKDNRLQTTLRWCSILVLFAGMLFRSGELLSDDHALRFFEIVTLLLILAGTVIVVVSVAWNLVQIHRSMRVKLSPELEKSMGLFSPHGSIVVTRWIRKQPSWQPVLTDVLKQLVAVCEIKSIDSKVPRRDSLSFVVQPDSFADAVVATFSGGVFRDDLVPYVRTWLTSGTQEQVPLFTSTFTSMGLATTSNAKSKTRFSSDTRITKAAVRNLSMLSKRDESKSQSKAGEYIALLYGMVAPNKIDPKQWQDPEWLIVLHQLYLRSVGLVDPVKRDFVPPQTHDIAEDIEIEMKEFAIVEPQDEEDEVLAEAENR